LLNGIQAGHAFDLNRPVLSGGYRWICTPEAAATLAVRDGRVEAIGFYLDNQRIHVGDLSTIAEHIFAAWQHDRSKELDSIMLAPTRELVAQLNLKSPRPPTRRQKSNADAEVSLADGNQACVDELIITCRNDRQLRLTATDWVQNGDRWIVQAISDGGDLDVQHLRNRHPAAYVQTSAELGYATTVHGAQELSVDTVHCLGTGDESRQQLYTMLSRGRVANHLYLQAVGDGDPTASSGPRQCANRRQLTCSGISTTRGPAR